MLPKLQIIKQLFFYFEVFYLPAQIQPVSN